MGDINISIMSAMNRSWANMDLGRMNNNGERLADLCAMNLLVIGVTCLKIHPTK